VRRLTSSPELTSVTTARGTSLRPAGRALVTVVGPEGEVTVAVVVVVGAVTGVVAEVAVRARNDAADLEVEDPLGERVSGGVGRAVVVAVVDVSSVVTVDELAGTEPAVEDVVRSVEATAARLSVPPVPAQAEPARMRAAPRAAQRRRTAATLPAGPPPVLKLPETQRRPT